MPAKHKYGDGFGAGRGHEGQDVFARCGKPIPPHAGGRVKYRVATGGRHYSRDQRQGHDPRLRLRSTCAAAPRSAAASA